MSTSLTATVEREDPSDGEHTGGPAPRGGEEGAAPPGAVTWYSRVVVSGLLVFVAFGLVGLVAAIAGVGRPAVVIPVGTVVAAGLILLWRPDRAPRAARAVQPWVVIVGVLVIAASTGWNAQHTGQHILTDRDQGIYVNGAKWIAEEGTLVVDGRGPGLDGVEGLATNARGQQVGTGDDDSELEIQAPHLLHTYMAEAEWAGGNRALFIAPVLIGALALAAFFLFALRLVPGPLALVALAGLVANFIWIYSVRDALSEPLLLLTTFGGAWLLDVAVQDGRRARLFIGGLVVGMGLTARLDAAIGVALVVTVTGLLSARRANARRRGREEAGAPPLDTGARGLAMMLFVVAGVAVAATIGFVDTLEHNTYYLRYHVDSVRPLMAFLALAVVAGLALVAAGAVVGGQGPRSGIVGRLRATSRWGARHLPALAGVAAGAVVLVAVFAWFVWPEVAVVRGEWPDGGRAAMEAIQVRDGGVADGNRTYAEGAVRRLAWYAGGPAVALGVAGMALVAYRVVKGRATTVELLLVAVAVPATVLFVWEPSIYADQPWMMRRYLPQVVPGLLLFGALAADAVARALALRGGGGGEPAATTGGLEAGRAWARIAPGAVALLAVVVVVGGALPVTVPLRDARTMAGGRDGIERLCAVIGPDAAVVMANEVGVGIALLPAVRGFCGVPAARPASSPLPLDDLLASTEAEGRTLWVMGHTPEVLESLAPTVTDVQPVSLVSTTALIPTVSKPPSELQPYGISLFVGRVDRAR